MADDEAEAPAVEEPPPPHPLLPTLEDPEIKALVAGVDAEADFQAVCEHLEIQPPVRLLRALR